MVQITIMHDSTSEAFKMNEVVTVQEVAIEPQTVDELLRARSLELLHSPLVSYPHEGLDYVDYSALQLDQFAYHVARQCNNYLSPRVKSSETALVVGLLGQSSLDYLIAAMAVQKLGHTALHLSTRISHEAYINLLQETNTSMVLVDDTMYETITKCKVELPSLQIQKIVRSCDYIHSVLPGLNTNLTPTLDSNLEQDTVAWIIHSSGSTGLPKPIYQTQRAALNNYRGNMNMRGFITLPLFHSHGISSTYRAIYSGKQIHIYNARIPLAKQYLMEVMKRYCFEIFYGVPYVLNLLAEDPEGVRLLSKCKIVMFGGSACPDELGDSLVERGVNLVSHWGSTETGQLMTSFRPAGDNAWNYLRPSAIVQPYLRMEERGEGLYEAVCLAGWPSKVATNRPDGSYVMKDLFTKHPQYNWWKYYGRLDDTIVLVNGEKAMPLPIEGAARQNSLVNEAVVFGRGKDRLGLALIRANDTDTKSAANVAAEVLSSIEKVQAEMPAYARISSDMVLVLDADTDYPRTDKGTVIRLKFYKRFEKEIDDLYQSLETQRGSLRLGEAELHTFVRQALQTLSADLILSSDDQDFFNAGMDSLQATRLRAAVVKDIDIGDNQLGINVAFEHPSISKLARHLYALRSGGGQSLTVLTIEEQMHQLIEEYGTFTPHSPQPQISQETAVILTGATGSLGAHIAHILAQDPTITKIYCLVRATSASQATERLARSLNDRGLPPLPPSSHSKLLALPSDLTKPNLGLDITTTSTLRSTITTIIHSAWSVNFNLHLSSFNDCILSAHNLMQFALSTTRPTPASFNFCSSVSTVMRTPTSHITESVPPLSHAQNMGYAQSKLVTEHLCTRASAQYNLCTRVLRIGQIIGDTAAGIWNKQEAIPTMIQSAVTFGALPTLDENARWLPVDIVARACVDIALQNSGSLTKTADCSVYNLLNPSTIHWTHDLLPLIAAQDIAFDAVPVSEWLERLAASDPDPSVNAPIKLLDFWTGKYGVRAENRDGVKKVERRKKIEYTWDTANTVCVSPVVRSANKDAVLDVVRLSLEYFRKQCW